MQSIYAPPVFLFMSPARDLITSAFSTHSIIYSGQYPKHQFTPRSIYHNRKILSCTSLVEQASIYSSCSLWCTIVTHLHRQCLILDRLFTFLMSRFFFKVFPYAIISSSGSCSGIRLTVTGSDGKRW